MGFLSVSEICIFSNYVLFVYLITLCEHLEAVDLTITQANCPVTFEQHSDLNHFGDYCQRMAFSLIRIKPDAYRENICYSKCLQSDTCVYYSYDAMTTFCIVCLRRLSEFAYPKTGTELVDYGFEPGTIFARIGLHIDPNACDFLDYTCATRWFGGFSGGEYNTLEIPNDAQITSLQFCQDLGYQEYLGGFKITFNTHESHTRGCTYPIWQNEFPFSTGEKITGLEIYYGDTFVHGLRFHTNEGNVYEEMGHMAGVGDQHCYLGRSDLVAIETRSGSLIDAIRFHFDDCE